MAKPNKPKPPHGGGNSGGSGSTPTPHQSRGKGRVWTTVGKQAKWYNRFKGTPRNIM